MNQFEGLPDGTYTTWSEAPPDAIAALIVVMAASLLVAWIVIGLVDGLPTSTRVLLLPVTALGVTMAPALTLAMSGALQPIPFLALVVLIGMAALALRVRRERLRLDRVRVTYRSRFQPSQVLAWAAMGAIVALALAPLILVSRVAALPIGTTTWYYLGLAVAVARSGGFPATMPEWGGQYAFQTDYAAVTASSAAFLQMSPDAALLVAEAYRVLVLFAVAGAAAAFFARWVPLPLALLGAWLTILTTFVTVKLSAYKPETPAVALAFLGLFLVDRWLVRPSRGLGLAIVGVAALLVNSHIELFLVWLAFIAGLVFARGLPVGRRRRPISGWLRVVRRKTLPLTGRTVAIVLAGATLGIAVQALLVGEVRLVGYAGSRTPVAVDPATLPPGWTLSGDPTWDFFVAATAAGPDTLGPPRRFTDDRLLPRSYTRVWRTIDLRTIPGRITIAIVALLPLAAWASLSLRQRRFIVWWAVAGGALLIGSVLIWAVSSTYVPMRVGPLRLVPYEVVPIVGAVLSLTWLLVSRLRRRLAGGPAAALVARGGLPIALIVGVVVAGGSFTTRSDVAPLGLSAAGWQMLRWIHQATPADSIVAANAYSDGALATVAGRTGALDGRAIYLEDRDHLEDVIERLLISRSYFERPAGEARERYFACLDPDYVLVSTGPEDASVIGGAASFPTDTRALMADPALQLVHQEGDLLLFDVDDLAIPDAACER